MIKVKSVKGTAPCPDDAFLFDTNVLMYVFYTNGNYRDNIVSQYADFFAKVVDSRAQIILPACVLSEFVSQYVKNECKRIFGERLSYKTYRNTAEYQKILKELAVVLKKQLLPFCTKINYDFAKMNVEGMIAALKSMEFNDHIIASLAQSTSCTVVTNDADFWMSCVGTYAVITANNRR